MTSHGLFVDGAAEILQPRPYQSECIRAILDSIADGDKRPACVLPTGSGKTVIFSHLSRHWNDYGFDGRVLILVHRDELVQQTVNKLHSVAPHLNVGIVQGKQNEHIGRDVIVASVQTVRKMYRLDEIVSSGEIGLVIVDECHHASAESYVTVMNTLGCFAEKGAVAVGFTATLSRNDSKSLGDVWEKVIYRRDILDMIRDGYLTDVKGKLVTVDGLSLSQVSMRGGDYQIGSLSDALLSAQAPEFVADAYAEHAAGRFGIIFTPSVATAEAFTAALNRRGIAAEAVWGGMDRQARRDVLSAAHEGRVQVLVNCMVLTEGFDWPRAEVAVIARPTTSSALYVQMVGRVLRRFPGKESALVLDVVGASEEHRLATLADLTSRRINLIQEGESLREAVRREKESQNEFLQDYVVAYEDVDLFGQSKVRWLQTLEGIWFVATTESVFFVWPGSEPGTYNVGTRPRRKRFGGGWLQRDVDLEAAKQWVEQHEEVMLSTMTTSRKASWRRTRVRATDAQLAHAKRLRIKRPDLDQMTKSDLSDLLEVHSVSRMLDPALRKGK